MLIPASRQMSISRVASATSLLPQALNSSPWPPKVPVPKVRTGTLSPEPPSCRYSILVRAVDSPKDLRRELERTQARGVIVNLRGGDELIGSGLGNDRLQCSLDGRGGADRGVAQH